MATPIEGLMSEAMGKLKEMIDVNTIVGEAINTCDAKGEATTVIPVSKVAFGFGAGGSEFSAKPLEKSRDQAMFGGGCGGGVSVKPVAFLVVRNDTIRLLPVTNTVSTVDKVVDMVPELLNKFNSFVSDIKCKFDKNNKADSCVESEE
ncbi:MAG: sporulation protein YtfJ [Ruminococcaceae bacterium]|nr:sporulation protein YtfJ [Oscillospiraceae bacterium]